MKRCKTCGSTENLFVNSRMMNDDGTVRYNYYMCRPCNTARARRYRQTKSGKISVSNRQKRYSENNPERVKCWQAVKHITQEPCEICGKMPTHKHHPDVKKPLFIIHLCPYHHSKAHKSKTAFDTEPVGHPRNRV